MVSILDIQWDKAPCGSRSGLLLLRFPFVGLYHRVGPLLKSYKRQDNFLRIGGGAGDHGTGVFPLEPPKKFSARLKASNGFSFQTRPRPYNPQNSSVPLRFSSQAQISLLVQEKSSKVERDGHS